MDGPPRYMDFLTDATGRDGASDLSAGPLQAVVIVMPIRDQFDRWHALWQIDDRGRHEEFAGTRSEALGWASERCPRVMIWSDESNDLIPYVGNPNPAS